MARIKNKLEDGAGRRGMLKLMMKKPAIRGRLQILAVTDDSILSLCGAFEDAVSTLENLRRQEVRLRESIAEYEVLCNEIEMEIASLCST